MTAGFAIQTIIEIVAVLFGVYALLHENKFVAFEDKIIRIIKKKIYLSKRRKSVEKKPQQSRVFVPPVLPKGEPIQTVKKQRVA